MSECSCLLATQDVTAELEEVLAHRLTLEGVFRMLGMFGMFGMETNFLEP